MLQYASRLRRAISVSSSLSHHHHQTTPPLNHPPSRFLTSTITSTSSPQSFSDHTNNEACENSPDSILFEGCDFNHWLIVIDFPKRPIKPSSQEMLNCYEQTAAKIFGSLEEAKKRIYACSTTIYTGFQVECSVETSEKFKDLPEVTYVLPDSYIDAVSKEYGGDKYMDGLIIPRPTAFKYGRLVPCGDWKNRPCVRGQTELEGRNYGSQGTHPLSQNSVQPHQKFGPTAPQRSNCQASRAQPNRGPPQQNNDSQSQQIYGPPRGWVHSQGSRRD